MLKITDIEYSKPEWVSVRKYQQRILNIKTKKQIGIVYSVNKGIGYEIDYQISIPFDQEIGSIYNTTVDWDNDGWIVVHFETIEEFVAFLNKYIGE